MLLLLSGAEAVRMPHAAVRAPGALRAALPQMTTDDESFKQGTPQSGDAVEGKAVSAEVVTSRYDAGVRLVPLLPSKPAPTRATALRMATAFPFFRAKGPSEKELEAIFYQADTELKGEISRQELVEPLVLKKWDGLGPAPFGPRLAALKAAACRHGSRGSIGAREPAMDASGHIGLIPLPPLFFSNHTVQRALYHWLPHRPGRFGENIRRGKR